MVVHFFINYSFLSYFLFVDQKKRMAYHETAAGELLTRNGFLRPHCNHKEKRALICSRTDFLDNMCSLSKFHAMKTVRLGLDVASKLLYDNSVNFGLKLIYIARDPRGLVNSRLKREWCVTNKRCIGAEAICKDLERDYWVAKNLSEFNQGSIK